MTDAAVLAVIRCHTCDAGVRQLARRLGAVCQFVACRGVETGDTTPVTIVADAEEGARLEPARRHLTVAEVLGPPRYDSLPDHVRDALSRERDHILGLHPADPAATAAQAWIEVMEAVPWRRAPAGPLDTPRELRRTLDREHVGRDHERTGRSIIWCPATPRRRDTRPASPPERPRSCASSGQPASGGPRSRGRWPRPSAGGSCGSPWPGWRTRRRCMGRPEPLPRRGRAGS